MEVARNSDSVSDMDSLFCDANSFGLDSEVAELRRELTAIHQEIAELRGRPVPKAVALVDRAGEGDVESMGGVGKRAADGAVGMGRVESDYCVELEHSCWTIPLFADGSSKAEAVLLLGLFALNIGLQAILCAVVVNELGEPSYRESDVAELVDWRRSIAHDARYYDTVRWKGARARVARESRAVGPRT